jgi:hypothetical protein
MHKRLLPLVVLSLTLLTTGCQKEDAPSLDGRWRMQTSFYYDYDNAGNRLSGRTDQVDTLGVYHIISANTMDYYDHKDRVLTSSTFTREGNTLHLRSVDLSTQQVTNRDLTIEELTDQRLTLRFTSPKHPTTGAYFISGYSSVR